MKNREMSELLLPSLYKEERQKVIEECSACGLCIETCPVITFSALADENPTEIANSVIEVFRGGPISELAFKRAFACVRCGVCWECCRQGLNPYMLQVILRAEMYVQGKVSPHEKRPPRIGEKVYSPNEVLMALTTKPEGKRWLTSPDENPAPKDYVIFLGCAAPVHSGMMNTLFSILDVLGIDYVALGAGNPCCGGSTESKGFIIEANKKRDKLIETILAYKAKKCVVFCPTCYFRLTKLWGSDVKVPDNIDILHVSHFLADNLDKLKFTKKLNKTVTLFDSCKMGRICKEFEAPRKVLRALPGVKVIETQDIKDCSCCGGGSRYFPEVADGIQRQTMDQFQKSGADIVVTTCQYCHVNFLKMASGYSFEFVQFLDLVGEAMGLDNEDKIKKYMKYHDSDRVIREALPCIEANSLSLSREELKYLLGLILP